MPVASCSCLRLEDTGYVQKPLSAYDPKTHPLCLHPGDKPSLEPFPAPPLLVSPQGVSHCVGKKKDGQINLPPKLKQPSALFALLLREWKEREARRSRMRQMTE